MLPFFRSFFRNFAIFWAVVDGVGLLWVIVLAPVQRHQAEILEIDLAIAVYIAGDACLARRLVEA
jgi:hypothetical protein